MSAAPSMAALHVGTYNTLAALYTCTAKAEQPAGCSLLGAQQSAVLGSFGDDFLTDPRAIRQICLALVFIAFSLLTGVGPASAQSSSAFLKKEPGNRTVIVFVHGVLGDAKDTWANNGVTWPSLLKDDPAFSGSDVYVLGYPTTLWASMSVDELADTIRPRLSSDGIPDYQRIVFLAHSMGGLITRSYLLKNRDVAAKVGFIYFLSTPTAGSQIASIATLISRNPQFSTMKPMNAEDFLADVLRQWLSADFRIPSYCAYEKLPTYGMMVVDFNSASALCNKALDPISESHITIAKPASRDSDSYIAFKAAFRKEISTSKAKDTLLRQFEDVLNLLHKTQMTKSEFLFPQLDSYIASPDKQKWRSIQRTARKLSDDIRGVLDASAQFDAQLYEEAGQQVVLIANGTRDVVDRKFYQTFREARHVRAANAEIMDQITTVELENPTVDQARAWAAELRQNYGRIETELVRLLDIIRTKS